MSGRKRVKLFFYCIIFLIIAGCTLWSGKQRLEPDEGDLIFSHKRHSTINIPCVDCHIRPPESDFASDNNIPKELTCMGGGNCHKRTQGCELCHKDVSRAVEIIPKQHRISFSHKLHLHLNEEQLSGKQQPDCITCHSVMKESTDVSDDDWPRMNVCRQCHDIEVEDCTTCHLSLGEKTFVPISHDNTWLSRHRQESQFSDQLCDVCHRGKIRPKASFKITEQSLENLKSEGVPDDVLKKLKNIKNQKVTEEEEFVDTLNKTIEEEQTVKFKSLILRHAKEEHIESETARSCADCHRGDIWPEDVHDNNYLYSHGVDALAGITTCTTCHQREACLSCHENGGITFIQSHPKGWTFNHSTEARRQINSCINCHEEEDCLGCHQTIRPHPENWDRDITSQNKQLCLKCHSVIE